MAIKDFYKYQAFAGASGGGGGGGISADDIAAKTISGTVSGNTASIVEAWAFIRCYSLTGAIFPNVTKIQSSAFASCSALTNASFANASVVNKDAFANCGSLQTVYFPKLSDLGASAFYNCSNLESIALPALASCNQNAFTSCKKLMTLDLTGVSAVPYLNHQNTFYSTPMSNSSYTGSFGSILVPSSLYSGFIADSVWTIYSDRLVSA